MGRPRKEAVGCSVEGCETNAVSLGMCNKHYKRFKRYGDVEATAYVRKPKELKTCSIEGCQRTHRSKGYCSVHYRSYNTHGDPLHADKQVAVKAAGCVVEGCGAEIVARTMCSKHYSSFLHHNDPTAAKTYVKGVCASCGGPRGDDNPKYWGARCEACYKLHASRSAVRKTYGDDGVELFDLIESGEASCAACGATSNESGRRLCIDHNHLTGEVRGVLCHPCNVALGFIDDDLDRLMSLAAYLMSSENVLGKVSR